MPTQIIYNKKIKKTQRQTDRQTERQTDGRTETERQTDRQRQRERERDREREKGRKEIIGLLWTNEVGTRYKMLCILFFLTPIKQQLVLPR